MSFGANEIVSQDIITLFPKNYKTYNNINKKDIIRIFGRVEKRFDQYQIIINSLKVLESK